MSHKLKLQSDNSELLIEYIDDYYNIYRAIIDKDNPIVKNLLGGEVVRFRNLIEPDIKFSIGNENTCIARINEPITLQFSLKQVNSSDSNEKINLLTRTVKQLESSNYELMKRLSFIENLIPYYGIPAPWSSRPNGDNQCSYRSLTQGASAMTNMYNTAINITLNDQYKIFDLKPLKLVKDLNSLNIHISQDTTRDTTNYIEEDKYMPINDCPNINEFKLKYDLSNINSISKLNNLNFISNLSKLREITIINATHLTDVKVLYSLDNLNTVTLINCGAVILDNSKFKPNVKINIRAVE